MDPINKPVEKVEKAEKTERVEMPAVPRGQAPAPKPEQNSQVTQPFSAGDKVKRQQDEQIMKKAAQTLTALSTVNPVRELSTKLKISEKQVMKIMRVGVEYGMKEREIIHVIDTITSYNTNLSTVLKLIDQNYNLFEITSLMETRKLLTDMAESEHPSALPEMNEIKRMYADQDKHPSTPSEVKAALERMRMSAAASACPSNQSEVKGFLKGLLNSMYAQLMEDRKGAGRHGTKHSYTDTVSLDMLVEFDQAFGGGEFEMEGTMRLLEILREAAPDRTLSRLIKDAVRIKSIRDDAQTLDGACRILSTRAGSYDSPPDTEDIDSKQDRARDPSQNSFEGFDDDVL